MQQHTEKIEKEKEMLQTSLEEVKVQNTKLLESQNQSEPDATKVRIWGSLSIGEFKIHFQILTLVDKNILNYCFHYQLKILRGLNLKVAQYTTPLIAEILSLDSLHLIIMEGRTLIIIN